MRKSLKLSAIALLTTAMTALPAYALSLNVGGNGPLVDLGNDNNADATVSVDTGNVLGDDGNSSGGGGNANSTVNVKLNDVLGGGSDEPGDEGLLGGNALVDLSGDDDGVVDLDLGTDGNLLDLGGDGALVDLADIGGTGDLLDLGDGPLLDLGGNAGTNGLVDVDLGEGNLLDLNETGGILDVGDTGDLLDLGSSGDLLYLGGTGSLLDLGGGAPVDLGGSSDLVALDLLGTKVDTDLNLDGGEKPVVDVTVGTGRTGVAGTGVLPDTDVDATVGGDNAATVTVTTGGDDGGGSGGNGGGGNGGNGGSGGGGNGKGDSGNGGSGNGGSGSTGGDLLAAGSTTNACLTLTTKQLNELVARHAYDRATFNSWASARQLKIVEVDLCDREVADVAAAVGGSANVARLQAFLAAQAKVRAGLESKGHSTGDVIAADHSGAVLIVYVI